MTATPSRRRVSRKCQTVAWIHIAKRSCRDEEVEGRIFGCGLIGERREYRRRLIHIHDGERENIRRHEIASVRCGYAQIETTDLGVTSGVPLNVRVAPLKLSHKGRAFPLARLALSQHVTRVSIGKRVRRHRDAQRRILGHDVIRQRIETVGE